MGVERGSPHHRNDSQQKDIDHPTYGDYFVRQAFYMTNVSEFRLYIYVYRKRAFSDRLYPYNTYP